MWDPESGAQSFSLPRELQEAKSKATENDNPGSYAIPTVTVDDMVSPSREALAPFHASMLQFPVLALALTRRDVPGTRCIRIKGFKGLGFRALRV